MPAGASATADIDSWHVDLTTKAGVLNALHEAINANARNLLLELNMVERIINDWCSRTF